ncbi:hypothetical protein OSTOST_01520 [Ostertagia ostertagi]
MTKNLSRDIIESDKHIFAGDSLSSLKVAASGVPQAGVLSPVLFNICTADLHQCTQSLDVVNDSVSDAALEQAIDFNAEDRNVKKKTDKDLAQVEGLAKGTKIGILALRPHVATSSLRTVTLCSMKKEPSPLDMGNHQPARTRVPSSNHN